MADRRRGDGRIRDRSRSRSPRSPAPHTSPKVTAQSQQKHERKDTNTTQNINKINDGKAESVSNEAKKRLKTIGVQMKLSSQKTPSKPKMTVANAFNQDSDEEPEEMPPEAKMRMRNIGRETPTSSGPNSFGKTKHGFSDSIKLFEKSLRHSAEQPLKNADQF